MFWYVLFLHVVMCVFVATVFDGPDMSLAEALRVRHSCVHGVFWHVLFLHVMMFVLVAAVFDDDMCHRCGRSWSACVLLECCGVVVVFVMLPCCSLICPEQSCCWAICFSDGWAGLSQHIPWSVP